jgi:hypothetical protein
MSENETEHPGEAPPQVDPISAPEPPEDQPEVNPDTEAAVGTPDGNSVDASEDPNLGHALKDQSHGVGFGPTQTSAVGEQGVDDDDVAGAV